MKKKTEGISLIARKFEKNEEENIATTNFEIIWKRRRGGWC